MYFFKIRKIFKIFKVSKGFEQLTQNSTEFNAAGRTNLDAI